MFLERHIILLQLFLKDHLTPKTGFAITGINHILKCIKIVTLKL